MLRYLANTIPDVSTSYTRETAPFNTSLVFAGLDDLPVRFTPIATYASDSHHENRELVTMP